MTLFRALLLALAAAALAGAVSPSGAVLTALSVNPSDQMATMTVLPPPSLFAASGSGGAVDLSWPASSTSPGSGHTLSYIVLRGPVGGPYATIATTGASVLSYSDTPPTDGTYGYVVKTQVSGAGAFQSANGAVASATSDRTAPTVGVTFPSPGGSYGSTSWGGASGAFSGTASDAGTGIPSSASIGLVITRSSTGDTWNGTSFASGSNTVAASSYDPSTGGWTYSFPAVDFPAVDSYSVTVNATDGAQNVGTSGVVSFAYGTRRGRP